MSLNYEEVEEEIVAKRFRQCSGRITRCGRKTLSTSLRPRYHQRQQTLER